MSAHDDAFTAADCLQMTEITLADIEIAFADVEATIKLLILFVVLTGILEIMQG